MAEKLYKCHCRVPGHGTSCEVAQDKKKSKRTLSKLRRRLAKNDCRRLAISYLESSEGNQEAERNKGLA